MKKIYLLLLSVFFVCSLNAQNCNFTYSTTPGTTVVDFAASPNIPLAYTYLWDFGDGTTSTLQNPSHAYNIPLPVRVCYQIFDATGGPWCTACDSVQVNSSSICSFSVSATGPLTYTFTALNVSPNNSIHWSFGDGGTAISQAPTHTYTSGGTYTVFMEEIDQSGTILCSYLMTINVSNGPSCNFSYQANPASNTATFWLNFVVGGTQTWDFGDGQSGTGPQVNHNYSAPGTYYVCLTSVDPNGTSCTSCDSVTVGGSTTTCTITSTLNSSSPLTIDFQVNGGANSTVSWDFGDNTIGTGANATHTYTASGSYNVCATVSVNGIVTCNTCTLVTVGNNTGCTISYTSVPGAINTYIFSLNTTSTSSFQIWTFSDGTTDLGNPVTHSFLNPGVYTVCVEERDSLQALLCQTCVTVTVGGLLPCNANFLATSLGLTAYFIDLSTVSSAGPANTSYSWNFGDGGTSNLRFPQHIYSLPGTYNVCLTIQSANCINTYCSPVIVDTLVNNPTTCTAFFTTVQLAPYQLTVVNLSSGLNLSFNWDFGDGTTDNSPYPSHFYNSTGSFNLCLTVSDFAGCTNTYCDTVSVDSLGNIFRSTTPGFTINVVSPSQLTSVGEIISSQSFSIYPNPVTSELNVIMASGTDKAISYRILSLQGAEVLSGTLNSFESKVNMQTLSSGAYLFEVSRINGSRSYQSLIKN